jgi:hypothetical protein
VNRNARAEKQKAGCHPTSKRFDALADFPLRSTDVIDTLHFCQVPRRQWLAAPWSRYSTLVPHDSFFPIKVHRGRAIGEDGCDLCGGARSPHTEAGIAFFNATNV